VGGFIISTASVTLSIIGILPKLTSLTIWNHFAITIIGFGFGAVIGAFTSARLFPVVSRGVIERQASWLRGEESLLILQAPIRSLSRAVITLRDLIETEISIFALHPQREFPEPPELRDLAAMTLLQIKTHASRLAQEHQVDFQGGSSRVLLEQLENSRQTIHTICSDLTESVRLEQSMSPVAEWILDNEYLIESHVKDVQLNLPKSFYRELPTLTVDPDRYYPRVYSLAKELVAHSDARLDREHLLTFLSAYQEGASLTIGELWALPLMLRISLIQRVEQQARQAWRELLDREIADFWANRLLSTLRRDPDQLFAVLAELAGERGRPSPFFATQLSGHLYDEDAALIPVQSWLERSLRKSLTELHAAEQSRQAANQISIGNAITSLRQLSLLDWREIFEGQSKVEQILRRDPARIYPEMDFETRNQYREVVEILAKGSDVEENQVARMVIEKARAAESSEGWESRQRHIGSYLIGEGRGQFSKEVGCRENLRFRLHQWVYRHHTALYLASITLMTLGLLAYPIVRVLYGAISIFGILALLLLTLPASQLATEWINYLISRILPARRLPKLDFSENGVPDAYRTLVVVPMLLTDAGTIESEIKKLEIRYIGNREHNLVFALFSDFMDAASEVTEEDAGLLNIAEEGIRRLNRVYGGGRFYLFHRQRTWSESEQKYIGWERKRGKLEELNRLILGQRREDEPSIVYVGEADRLTDIRYVITLDSDTQLPRDSARRMIETLAHTLNQPRYDKEGKVAKGTYTLIQPRVSSSLPSATASLFSRIFTDPVGTDPYTKVVSNAYQDLSGEGSYIGKGIYDPRAFQHMLTDRFPDESLLSHDLIEGAYVRTGLASDIELFDEFPSDYISYSRRQHRWIRGDWQIAEWIFPKVMDRNQRRIANILGPLSRWKILDNLRRSLVPIASLVVLTLTWLLVPDFQLFTTVLIAGVILSQPIAGPLTWVTTRQGLRAFSLRQIQHDLTRALAEAALLMYQAGLALDAIVRVLYRRLISRRRMLEWSTAQMDKGRGSERQDIFRLSFWLISLLSSGLGVSVYLLRPESLSFALPWLILWFISPLVGGLLTMKKPARAPHQTLSERDTHMLRRVARRTWRYFADFVGPETAWLPPDNYQYSHKNQLAMRTSPTNIGMWMMSALAANDFGYLTLDQTIERLTQTMKTLNELERHEGHLLNWYNLEVLAPLSPRYVSSVDSGNFIAALWTLEQGIAENLERPILSSSALGGLQDTTEILLEEIKLENAAGETQQIVLELLDLIQECPPGAIESIRLLRVIKVKVESLAALTREDAGTHAGAAYWARQLERQVTAWTEIIDRYLGWMEILAERSESELVEVDLTSLLTSLRELHSSPSLKSLAAGQIAGLSELDPEELKEQVEGQEHKDWIERLVKAFSDAKWFSGEMLALGEKLGDEMRIFTDEINMRFLYDPVRCLFYIGYNVTANQFDGSYYDLLASESRLGSYVAIARGDVPIDHWLALNRPYSSHGQHRVLLSWTGTMFEYLMPLLLQRSYPNSLLDQATRETVALQMAYGRNRRVPWGISESAYGDLDLNKTYQYKAFGVPWLGLKRGLDEDLVVAPYATLLAVGLEPHATVKNLERLKKHGLFNDYGFFEAIDFNRRPKSEAEPGVIVRAYMAHHQGMAFLSLTNFLYDNAMQRRFHSDPRVKAAEPLLYERVPVSPPIHHISTREQISSRVELMGVAPSVSKFETAHSITPKVQLLSNGQLSTMTTTAGGGYTRWKDMDVTRWSADTTRDAYGSFLYLRDTDSGEIWSNLYHPIDREPDRYSVHFPLDRAEYRRRDNGLETRTELIVSPEDDVEIRRITIINRSLRNRRIQATSYYELALASHGADRQHPAFNKLFIQTEAVPTSQALLAYRRPRQEEDPPIYAVHSLDLIGSTTQTGLAQFETDRRVFIGRGQSLRTPMAIETKLGNNEGYVLDPVFSIRREVILAPGESAQLVAILGVAEDREKALRLARKYHDSAVVERAFEIAWASTQLKLRSLRIKPDEARRFQKLAGYLLYPSSYLRPPTDRIEANRKGQSDLWPYGISGDLPILLITISDVGDLGLVRQMLQAQAYWRQHGLLTDLVVLNEESSSYDQPLMERLERLIQSSSIYTGEDQTGGVFLRAVDQIAEEDLILLQAVARVSLVAARGPLAQQIGVPHETVEEPEPLDTRRTDDEPSRPLPFLELPYFNSLGGFSKDGREYVIYLGPDTNTPAPWVNVIANPQFGTLISEKGAGFTWYGNSQRNRLTQWSNDPVLDPHSEVIYIRDENSGKVWNPTAGPIRENTAYRASHGAGYSRFEHNSHAIEQYLTIFVPVDDKGGEPVKISKLTLRNDSRKTRKLSITYYVEWTLGEQREDTQQHVVTEWDPKLGMILARNGYHPDYGDRVAFASISPSAGSFTCDRLLFLGRNQTNENPDAMKRTELAGRVGAGLDPCGALQTKLELAPGESADVICVLGQAATEAEAGKLVRKYREALAVNQALDETQHFWDRILNTVQVETPELSVNLLLNRWLLYQSLSCRIWGRSAFYQSGGAIGFRDQLQDVAAFLLADPALAREHILLTASRQYTGGDVQHWWHPPGGAGIRSRISDDLLWLPFITAQYVQVTGDENILHEQIPFLIAPELEPDQHEIFLEPQISPDKETLFEHCWRAVERGLTKGPNGLPLIGTGDWNDGMNRVGEGGRGESVWLGWFLIEVLGRMERLSEIMGETDLASKYRREADALEVRIEGAAWDGAWYQRATFDDGSVLGSAANIEARIDSLPQSWPWISDAGDPARKEQALESAWRQLVRVDEKLVLLFTPPFDISTPSPGYISGYPPGVRENGGQYTHAALWLAMAFARKGDGNRAGEILRILNPIEHARDDRDVWRYTVEPYVVAADVYRLPGRIGQGGWSWYTGSAAWMYRVWTEEVLGMKKRGDRLIIDPVIPDWWDGFKVTLRHGEAIYVIEVQNPDHIQQGVTSLELDGQSLEERFITLDPEPVKHIVRVLMGK
jgi:cyclic beta-1,2-glucan synthetase